MSIVLLLLLRVLYKPLDVSFLNSDRINFKGYIGKFENINSEFSFIDNEIIESTFLYLPILNLGDQLLSLFNLSSNSINFFN